MESASVWRARDLAGPSMCHENLGWEGKHREGSLAREGLVEQGRVWRGRVGMKAKCGKPGRGSLPGVSQVGVLESWRREGSSEESVVGVLFLAML